MTVLQPFSTHFKNEYRTRLGWEYGPFYPLPETSVLNLTTNGRREEISKITLLLCYSSNVLDVVCVRISVARGVYPNDTIAII
jgi:hypothetical protein